MQVDFTELSFMVVRIMSNNLMVFKLDSSGAKEEGYLRDKALVSIINFREGEYLGDKALVSTINFRDTIRGLDSNKTIFSKVLFRQLLQLVELS